MDSRSRVILGIDPGLANTGWGVIQCVGKKMQCVAYGCISTPTDAALSERLLKIYRQIFAVVSKFKPQSVGIETVWFGENARSAFATGQARGAALVACAAGGLDVAEFAPKQIKMAIAGTGSAEKQQIQYMVKQILSLENIPHPDHAADALAAAICCTMYSTPTSTKSNFEVLVERAIERDNAARQAYLAQGTTQDRRARSVQEC